MGANGGTASRIGRNSADKEAPPKVPVRMPIRVMPIWMVDKNWLGDSARARAARAARSPRSARFCRRVLRDETIAISDIEKIPFATVKAATIASSVRAELIRDETTTSVMACRPGKKRAIAQRGQIYTVILLLLIPSCPDVASALPPAWGRSRRLGLAWVQLRSTQLEPRRSVIDPILHQKPVAIARRSGVPNRATGLAIASRPHCPKLG